MLSAVARGIVFVTIIEWSKLPRDEAIRAIKDYVRSNTENQANFMRMAFISLYANTRDQEQISQYLDLYEIFFLEVRKRFVDD